MSISIKDFKTTEADKYGEAFGLIGLIPGTTAYKFINDEHCFTIGYTDEWGEDNVWVCQIDEIEDGCIGGCEACYTGNTPQEALENACVECVSVQTMREEGNCEDAVNVMAGNAYEMLHDGGYPDTDEDWEQYGRMQATSTAIVKKCCHNYGFEWEPYQICDAD